MKALVLCSGGLDSSVALALAVKKYGANEVLALSIYYGQKHQKEVEAAKKITSFYDVKHSVLDLGVIFQSCDCALLKNSDKEIPKEDYATQLERSGGSPVDTYVPFRNGLFLSAAASIALSWDCQEIYYGAHSDDAAGNAYPDTSTEFNEAINSAIYLGSDKKLQITAPFIEKTKADIVALGQELNVPFELTWSCYEGEDKACGICGTCRDRIQAFKLNDLIDPIEYAKEEFKNE